MSVVTRSDRDVSWQNPRYVMTCFWGKNLIVKCQTCIILYKIKELKRVSRRQQELIIFNLNAQQVYKWSKKIQ